MINTPTIGTSRSDEVIRKHKEYLWPAVTNFYKDPLVVDRGQMQYIWDLEGRRYLDFFGGILTISVGHSNPKVTREIKAQIDRLQHTSTLYPNEPIVELAEKVAEITPGKLQKSFFTNSGSEANEAALLLARMATDSYDVVALRHGYSGASALTKAVTAQAPWRKGGIVSVGVSHAINPYCYRCPLHLKYPECEVACADDVENLIQTGTSGHIAAFIAEPIQGVGGFITPPPEYFKMVFRTVKKYGGLFISDEVQTGFGRTGKNWFGIEHWEVTPDIITCAKGMADGTPIGATVTTSELADKFQGLTISTFGGNPVTSVAARATIAVIEEEQLLENARTVGDYFRQALKNLQTKHALIGDVRGMGLMQGLELVNDRQTKEPAPDAANQLLERTRANGLLIGKGGLYANVIRLSPMLNIGKADVDEAVRLLDKIFFGSADLGEVRVPMIMLPALAKRLRLLALPALVLLLWLEGGMLFAAGHAVTWKPNAEAMVRVDEHPLTDWNVYQMGKKTNPVLLQMGKRYLLIDQQRREIFEVDAGQVSRKGADISWDPADHPEKPLETANWIVKDVGQAYRVSARLVAEGRLLDVQVPHPLNLKALR